MSMDRKRLNKTHYWKYFQMDWCKASQYYCFITGGGQDHLELVVWLLRTNRAMLRTGRKGTQNWPVCTHGGFAQTSCRTSLLKIFHISSIGSKQLDLTSRLDLLWVKRLVQMTSRGFFNLTKVTSWILRY